MLPSVERNMPHNPLVLQAPAERCEVCVVMPVRDESERIEKSLHALAHQRDVRGQPIDPERYEVILLANNCQDNTAALARTFGQAHPFLRLHVVEITLPKSRNLLADRREPKYRLRELRVSSCENS
jgi:glycosyltransferase involved in cell wall biosynthesis